VVATSYAFVWPRPKPGVVRPVWRHAVLRWGHTAVWLLLAASCFLRSGEGETVAGPANALALLGGVLYVGFIASTAIDRRG